MAIPTKTEIAKKAENLARFMKQIDGDGKIKESTGMSMVRSAIRLTWMRAPNKLAVLEQARVPDMNPATRTKWLFQCAICGKMFKQTDIEVDHVIGEHKFTQPTDFVSYWDNMLNVPMDGLQVLCIEDHRIKTYMERKGCTWEEAVAKKVVIKYGNKPVKEQKAYLKKEGFKPAETTNAEKREKCWTILHEQGMIS